MTNTNAIGLARKKLMCNRRVVCTGNPDRAGTLASGFKKIFPDAVFLCRSTGWDLTDTSDANKQKLATVFAKSNTFLNCSYVAPLVQSWLLTTCHETVKFCDVINIGSAHEFGVDSSEIYKSSKQDLRTLSLKYNSFRFSTCHLIVGGIKTDNSEQKKDWLDIDLICNTVVSIWQLPYIVPLMYMEQHKRPW